MKKHTMLSLATAAGLSAAVLVYPMPDMVRNVNTVAQAETLDDLTYEKSDDHITITKCDSYAAEKVEIPAQINGVPVTEIKSNAFENCYEIEEIVIPETVTKIGENSFRSCENLKRITLPDSITVLPNSAFNHCFMLEEVKLPAGLTEIQSYVFYECSNLKSLTIPDTVTRIEKYAFAKCSALETVVLPENLTRISDGLFLMCSSLKEITIPEKVNRIGIQAFYLCSTLKEIVFPESVKTFDTEVLRGCDSLETIAVRCPAPHIERQGVWGAADPAKTSLDSYLLKLATVYGTEGSSVQTFAEANNFPFKTLEELPGTVQPEPPFECPLAPEGSVFCDADGDMEVTAADAQLVLRYAVDILAGKRPTWKVLTERTEPVTEVTTVPEALTTTTTTTTVTTVTTEPATGAATVTTSVTSTALSTSTTAVTTTTSAAATTTTTTTTTAAQ